MKINAVCNELVLQLQKLAVITSFCLCGLLTSIQAQGSAADDYDQNKLNEIKVLLDNLYENGHIPNYVVVISKNGENIYIELSGGINSNNINSYCIKGVDGISMGALTHNIKSKDISLDIK